MGGGGKWRGNAKTNYQWCDAHPGTGASAKREGRSDLIKTCKNALLSRTCKRKKKRRNFADIRDEAEARFQKTKTERRGALSGVKDDGRGAGCLGVFRPSATAPIRARRDGCVDRGGRAPRQGAPPIALTTARRACDSTQACAPPHAHARSRTGTYTTHTHTLFFRIHHAETA